MGVIGLTFFAPVLAHYAYNIITVISIFSMAAGA
jgi:hypothetical protein